MKIDKKKVVFGSVIVIVLIFIGSYSFLVFSGEEIPDTLQQPLVPELEEEQETYTSKMDALDDLKEEREKSIPSVYSQELLDSLGPYAPALEEEQEWVPDSTYVYGIVAEEEEEYYEEEQYEIPGSEMGEPLPQISEPLNLSTGHASFFLSATMTETFPKQQFVSEESISAEVHGNQTLRNGDRLELILIEEARLAGEIFPKNTLLYGFVSLQLNRVHIDITNIKNRKIDLVAYDLQDGNQGIYVRNSFRAEAGREVLDDIVQDINIAGLPQISGIKNIFRRNNQNLKVTILDQYKLLLKVKQ